jgi:anti-sigma factor ChrR (cupin superfamily)
LRYAPFFARLGRLWHLSEDDVRRELTRARNPRTWSLTWLPGVQTFEVGASSGVRSRLLRFGAGVHFPKHRHRAAERVLVLEGSYVDSMGRAVCAGDEQLMPAGSEHQLRVSNDRDCIAAVREGGIEFTGAWLGWMAKLFR